MQASKIGMIWFPESVKITFTPARDNTMATRSAPLMNLPSRSSEP